MGVFDNIAKKAKESVDSATKAIGSVTQKVAEQTSDAVLRVSATTSDIAGKIGKGAVDLASEGARSIGNGVAYLGESISEASDGDYTKLKGMATATGDFVVDAAKDMTGINAYNHYQAAKENREEAEAIARRVETEVEKVRYLANERLQYMGEIRLAALKNTVGRFIDIVDRMNQGVKDKEYEMLTQIEMSEGELKEMEIVAIDRKKMGATVGIGVTAAAAAAMGVQKAVMFGVQKLAVASTGTAIKQLSGAAAQKATMAWLGGGSVASGGGGMALGASRMAMLSSAAAGVTILTTAATVASMYYSQKHTEATQYLADVKVWEAKTMAACELMKMIVRRSDEIATLTTRLETRCSDALDSLDEIADHFNPNDLAQVKTFQKTAILVKSVSQLCQTPLIDENGELNQGLDAVTLKSERILNKNL